MAPEQKKARSGLLYILALSHLVTDLSQGALPVLLPFLQTAFNLTYAQLGAVVLMQNLMSSVIQPLFGFITDRISLPWLLPAGVLISGLGMALTGFVPSYHILLLVIIIGGLGIASFHPQGSKSVHYVSAVTAKGRSMAVFSVGGNLGMAVGALFMSFLLALPGGLTNTKYFFIPAAAAATLLFIFRPQVTANTPAATRTHSPKPGRTAGSIKVWPLVALLAYIFIRSTIQNGLMSYIPLYYVNYLGGDTVYASYMVSVFLLAGAVGTFLGGTLSDRFGRKIMLATSMIILLPLLILYPHTSGLSTLALLTVTGTVLISTFAITIVLAQEMMPQYLGMASGLTIGFSIGLGGLGVTILGWLADHWGLPAVFEALSVLPLAGLALTFSLPGKITRAANTARL